MEEGEWPDDWPVEQQDPLENLDDSLALPTKQALQSASGSDIYRKKQKPGSTLFVLPGLLNPSVSQTSSSIGKLTDMKTDQPVLQLGNSLQLKGQKLTTKTSFLVLEVQPGTKRKQSQVICKAILNNVVIFGDGATLSSGGANMRSSQSMEPSQPKSWKHYGGSDRGKDPTAVSATTKEDEDDSSSTSISVSETASTPSMPTRRAPSRQASQKPEQADSDDSENEDISDDDEDEPSMSDGSDYEETVKPRKRRKTQSERKRKSSPQGEGSRKADNSTTKHPQNNEENNSQRDDSEEEDEASESTPIVGSQLSQHSASNRAEDDLEMPSPVAAKAPASMLSNGANIDASNRPSLKEIDKKVDATASNDDDDSDENQAESNRKRQRYATDLSSTGQAEISSKKGSAQKKTPNGNGSKTKKPNTVQQVASVRKRPEVGKIPTLSNSAKHSGKKSTGPSKTKTVSKTIKASILSSPQYAKETPSNKRLLSTPSKTPQSSTRRPTPIKKTHWEEMSDDEFAFR